MKKLFTILLLLAVKYSFAQVKLAAGVRLSDLPVVYLPAGSTVHFISPENISYVDISTKNIIGDLPVKNILRLKYRQDSLKGTADTVITIAGEKFLAQYHILYCPDNRGAVETDIEVMPSDMLPLDFPGIKLSAPELKSYAIRLFEKKPGSPLQQSRAFGLTACLYHIYTLGDYVFLDIGYENNTKLSYDIDGMRFKVDDKKVTKASTVQSLEITPELALFDQSSFKKRYRNIFVFKKFTFPGNKLLHIE